MTLDGDKLAAAKLWLLSAPAPGGSGTPRDLPYLAQALYALVAQEAPWVHRMSCDERWRIAVNPEWLASAPVDEVAGELAHMVWHLLSDHAARARAVGADRSTAREWAVAADLPIAETLSADGIRAHELTTPAERGLPSGRSAEEYFAALSGLPARPDDDSAGDHGYAEGPAGAEYAVDPIGCGSGADGIPRAWDREADSALGAVSSIEARAIRSAVAIAFRDHVMRRGTDPGDALRWAEAVDRPSTPWQEILAAAVRRAAGWVSGRGHWTFARRSRRAAAVPSVILPGQVRPIPRVSVVVDTSASVDDELLERALGEIDGVVRGIGVGSAEVTVYSVDAAVHATSRVRTARDVRLVGAGGTDLRVGIEAAVAERPRPGILIVVTDGDTPWPAAPPSGVAVVVALLGRRGGPPLPPTPPWAHRVECLIGV